MLTAMNKAVRRIKRILLPSFLRREYHKRWGALRYSHMRFRRPRYHDVVGKQIPKLARGRIVWVHGSQLLSPLRFDIPIKALFAKHWLRGVHKLWAEDLYLKHLKIWNGFFEKDPAKASASDFLRAFEQLLLSVKKNGFRSDISVVPVAADATAANGAHRIATSIALNKKLPCTLSRDKLNYSYYFFKEQDTCQLVSEQEWDSVALQYSQLRQDVRTALVFPSAQGNHIEIQNLLSRCGSLVYERPIPLEDMACVNLIRVIYQGERWLGSYREGFGGAREKSRRCFPLNHGDVRLFLLQTTCSPEKLRSIKAKIRSLFGIGKHSIHISDTHEESLRILERLLNSNALGGLRFPNAIPTPNFHRLMKRLARWISQNGIDPSSICVTGSAVLAAHGIRDCRDIDILHSGPIDPRKLPKGIGSHSSEQEYYDLEKEMIIYHPQYHFMLNGIKFASLQVIHHMKANRGEKKDEEDLGLMAA